MNRIDNPLGVSISQLDDNPESTPLEITLKLATIIPFVAVADTLREHFLNHKRFERIKETFLVFQAELEALQKECAGNQPALDAQSNFLKSSEFAEAVIAAAEEAVRSTNVEKIKRLGRVLANGSEPEAERTDDDLSSFVRDITQLSEGDIRVLEQLASAAQLFGSALASQTSPPPSSPFQDLINDAEREKLLTEDFYSHCFRLVGFGLSAQIPGNSPSLVFSRYSFRLTRRGHRLLKLLRHHS